MNVLKFYDLNISLFTSLSDSFITMTINIKVEYKNMFRSFMA